MLGIALQLMLFGSLNSTRIDYGDRTGLAFKHLYLLDWDPQFETLPYPPSAGIHAVYTREKLYEAVGYALKQVGLWFLVYALHPS